MPPILKNLAAVGIARQTSGKGTPASQPDFFHGLLSGTAFDVTVDQTPEDRTAANNRATIDVNRLKVVHGMKFTCRVHPKVAGLYLYAALGAIASVGTAPTVHTITPASDVPYLTFWGQFAGGIQRVQDCKIDSLTIKWSGPGPLEMDVVAVGCIPGWPGSITPVVDEQFALKYQAGGGIFKEDTASNTPAVAPITAGQIAISNNLTPLILATSVVPQDVLVGNQTIMPDLTTVPNDLAEFRKIITGTGAGTVISENPIYGSYDQKFVLDANTSIQVVCPRTAFAANFPAADPKGGATEVALAGVGLISTDGATPAATVTVKNTQTGY